MRAELKTALRGLLMHYIVAAAKRASELPEDFVIVSPTGTHEFTIWQILEMLEREEEEVTR